MPREPLAGAVEAPSTIATDNGEPGVSDETIEIIAQRVIEKLSDRLVREIACDAVPRIAEKLIREALEQEKTP
jgi:hypothetical protein